MFFKPKLKSYLFGRFSEIKYSEFLTSFITVLGYSCPKSGDDDDNDDDDNDDDDRDDNDRGRAGLAPSHYRQSHSPGLALPKRAR